MNTSLSPIASALLGVAAGAVGYWITTFWMKPILQYRDLRRKVFADLIFYAQVVNAEGLNDRMKELYEERIAGNRRNSAELFASVTELPYWYKRWLRRVGQAPETAAKNLIGFSNTTDSDSADKRVQAIRKALGYKAEAT